MKIAEITISCGRSFTANTTACIGFEDNEAAAAEFGRLKEYLDRREKRANDLEKTITVTGTSSFTCPGDEITGIGYVDYARENAAAHGVRDAFPNLFKA